MKYKKPLFFSALFFSFSNPLPLMAQVSQPQSFTHNHGQVEFQVTQIQNQLVINLAAPSADLMGFESEPKTTDQKIAFNRAMTILKNPKTFMAVNSNAVCNITGREVKHRIDKNSDHSDVFASYTYTCEHADRIKDIKYHWFTSFPDTKKITVVATTKTGKIKTGEVTATSRRFYF